MDLHGLLGPLFCVGCTKRDYSDSFSTNLFSSSSESGKLSNYGELMFGAKRRRSFGWFDFKSFFFSMKFLLYSPLNCDALFFKLTINVVLKSVFKKFFLEKSIVVEKCSVLNQNCDAFQFVSNFYFFSAVIGQELLTNTEVLLLCVQHVRTLCQRACPSNSTQDLGLTEVCLIKLDPKDTIWLADFMANQREQCSVALEKLLKIRDEIVQLAYKACMVRNFNFLGIFKLAVQLEKI